MLLPLLPLLLLSLSPLLLAQLPDNASDLPTSQLLTLASTALTSGKSNAALEIYDYCLSRDPTDFGTLYKRATVRLATGQWARAKEGFEEVLRVRQFDQAYKQLAKLELKLGELEEAQKWVDQLKKMLKETKKDGKDVEDANQLANEIKSAQASLLAAKKAFSSKPPKLDICISSCTSALVHSPNSEQLRLLRAECHYLASDFDATVADLSRAATLSPSLSSHLLLRISLLSSLFLDHGLDIPKESLLSIKKCLSADPESKPCKKAHRSLRAVEKEVAKVRNWVESNSGWTNVAVLLAGSSTTDGTIKTIKNLIAFYQSPESVSVPPLPTTQGLETKSHLLGELLSTLCRAYISLGQTKKAGMACANVLERKPEDKWGLIGKGDKALADEDWEEAVRSFNKAFEASGRSDNEILARLQKAQRLLKQSTAKDYYKVLGVSRDADAKTIKRAYRKATLKNHPDKPGGSQDKMSAINEAYEVLSTPELRQRFDNGEDPNDSSQQQGGHPFQQGGGQAFANFFQQQQQQGQQFFHEQHFNFKFGG